MTDDEERELSDLQNEMRLCSLGDRPQSMAAGKLRRLIELEADKYECSMCQDTGKVPGIMDKTDLRDCHVCGFADDFSSYLEAFDAYFGGAMDMLSDAQRADLFERGQRYTEYVCASERRLRSEHD